jgi:hypothetical protein
MGHQNQIRVHFLLASKKKRFRRTQFLFDTVTWRWDVNAMGTPWGRHVWLVMAPARYAVRSATPNMAKTNKQLGFHIFSEKNFLSKKKHIWDPMINLSLSWLSLESRFNIRNKSSSYLLIYGRLSLLQASVFQQNIEFHFLSCQLHHSLKFVNFFVHFKDFFHYHLNHFTKKPTRILYS